MNIYADHAWLGRAALAASMDPLCQSMYRNKKLIKTKSTVT